MKKTFLFLRVLAIAIVSLLLGGVEEARATAGVEVFYSTSTTQNLPPSYSTSPAGGFAGTETKLRAIAVTGNPDLHYALAASTFGADALLIAAGQAGGSVNFSFQSWNGSAWTLLLDNQTLPALAIRSFDTAFYANDPTNRRGLAVYKLGTAAADLNWRVFYSTANALGAQASVGLPAAVYRWVRLEPQPGTNNVLLVAFNDTSDQYEIAWFDGANNTWTSVGPITGSDVGSTTMARWFDVAFEQSGAQRGMIVMEFASATTDYISYATWTTAGLSSTMTIPTPTGASFNQAVMAAKPGGDEITLVVSSGTGASPELGAWIWTGSSWTASAILNANVGHGAARPFDVAYERNSGDALVAYRSVDTTTVKYRTRASGIHTWGAETIGGDLDTGDAEALEIPRWMTLTSDPDSALNDIYLLATDGSATDGTLSNNVEVHFQKWDGASWGTLQTLETNTLNTAENFSMVFPGAGTPADTNPPGGVSNLTALSGSVEGEIVLRWKAPGDDGESGNLPSGSTFRIKYSSVNIISSGNFDSPASSLAVVTINIATGPVTAGINVSTTVSNLTVGSTYWFAIKTLDEVPNASIWTSSADNVSFNTLASTVPGAILPNLFLNASDISHTNLTAEPLIVVYVTATIRNNGGTQGYTGPTYITFFATNTTTNTNYFISQATLGVVTPALSGSTQAFSGSWTIPVEGLYNYWVKIDSANTISESNENDNNASVTAEHPVRPPNGISNLTALTGPTEGQVILRWTAPGDDGTAGQVSGYALRIASAPIKSADFNSSWVQVTTPSWASNPSGNSATNVSGGTDVSVTLTGLLAGGVTYFALRGIDDVSSYGVWNSTFESASVNTLVSTMVQVDVTAPSAITTLSAALYSPAGIVTLTWTAPGEDGTTSSAAATYYDIRYATFSFTDRTAAGVLVATYTPTPSTRGSNETFRIGPGFGGVISGLRSGQEYFFNVWSQDDRGNFSDVTSPEASTPVVHLVISEVRVGPALDTDNEFVELFNPTTAAIDLSVMGITLHKVVSGGADSNFSLNIRPGRESIPSNGFWLITDRVGYNLAVSSDADFAQGNDIADDNALYISTYATRNQTNVYIDLVGFGTNGNFETTSVANLVLNKSIERKASGGLDPTVSPGNTQGNGFDENNNSTDFVERAASDPQNFLSAVEGDTRIPGGISNLTALAQANGDVILEWTSPGDDEQTGDLILGSQFRIKYSSVAILSSSNFDSPAVNLAVSTITISTTTTAGSAQRRTITGLSASILYWFAIKTKDEVGNWSVWNSSADVLTINTAATVITTTHLGASVDLASFDFGQLQPGTTSVSTSSGSVTNTGNITQRFLVRVSNSADFTLTTGSPGADQFRYSIVFSTATPTSADFDTNDAATTSNQVPSATIFARDGDGESVKGFNVAPGGTRFLWMRFEAPTSASVGGQQNIFVTVVAEQMP